MALDSKMIVDDNALSRQPALAALHDPKPRSRPRPRRARWG